MSQTLLHLRKQFAGSSADNHPAHGLSPFVADHRAICVRAQLFQTDVARFEQLVQQAHAQTSKNAPASECATLWAAALREYCGDLLPGFYDDWVDDERNRLNELWQQAKHGWQDASAQAAAAAQSQAPEAATLAIGLPLILTRFFGREIEMAQIHELLTQKPPVRLVTLIGMGGIGKTRLALEAARQLTISETNAPPAFGLVAFAPLADIYDAAHIGAALSQSLSLEANINKTEDTIQPALRFLQDAGKKNGRVLLILDNLEQFGLTCAPIVTRLLTQAPFLTILVTSRQPVGIAGEQEILIGPLSGRSDRQLFIDRARLTRPDFALSPQNEKDVGSLCALLEGVPLALELAAAWARTLSPAQITLRLHNRFDLLALRGVSGGDVPKRHQSLHAALAWSYDLLPPSLQTFFAQLSVFRGGWTAEAAQSVTGVKEASEPLLLLVERSLILVEPDESGAGSRYRMLESLREFAQEQSASRGSADFATLCLRHAQYFDELSQQADAMIKTGRGIRLALTLLGPERENLRIALARMLELTAEAVADAGRIAGVQIAVQTVWLWSFGEPLELLRLAYRAALLLPEETGLYLRALVLSQHGLNAMLSGDYSTARHKMHESLALWEDMNNQEKVIATKNRLGSLARRTGDPAGAVAAWAECLQFARKSNDPLREAAMLNNLAIVGPDIKERQAWIERAVALHRRYAPDSHLLACSLNIMGDVALAQNDRETAQKCLEEAHDFAVADGAIGMTGVAKSDLAEFLHGTNQQLERADSLLQEAQALFGEKGESPQVAHVLLLRFQIALKRGDAAAALGHAREQLRVIREAKLTDTSEFSSAKTEAAIGLRNAGFEHQAEQMENITNV